MDDLTVDYGARRSLTTTREGVRAVEAASFSVHQGTTLGLVGESGSGKTTIARAIVGLMPYACGSISVMGRRLDPRRRSLKETGRVVQMVFQQPGGSLDPTMRAGDSIAEPLRHLAGMRGRPLQERVERLLGLVGLESSHASRYPRQLSGGQRQRVAIARAVAINPPLIICDEPTSSLDVSVQAQIINLLVSLQEELGLTYLFISHDLGVVRQIADRVAVMQRGHIVEIGPVEEVLSAPAHPYTQALIAAVPAVLRAGAGSGAHQAQLGHHEQERVAADHATAAG